MREGAWWPLWFYESCLILIEKMIFASDVCCLFFLFKLRWMWVLGFGLSELLSFQWPPPHFLLPHVSYLAAGVQLKSLPSFLVPGSLAARRFGPLRSSEKALVLSSPVFLAAQVYTPGARRCRSSFLQASTPDSARRIDFSSILVLQRFPAWHPCTGAASRWFSRWLCFLRGVLARALPPRLCYFLRNHHRVNGPRFVLASLSYVVHHRRQSRALLPGLVLELSVLRLEFSSFLSWSHGGFSVTSTRCSVKCPWGYKKLCSSDFG
jgi:hypothetical protein